MDERRPGGIPVTSWSAVFWLVPDEGCLIGQLLLLGPAEDCRYWSFDLQYRRPLPRFSHALFHTPTLLFIMFYCIFILFLLFSFARYLTPGSAGLHIHSSSLPTSPPPPPSSPCHSCPHTPVYTAQQEASAYNAVHWISTSLSLASPL